MNTIFNFQCTAILLVLMGLIAIPAEIGKFVKNPVKYTQELTQQEKQKASTTTAADAAAATTAPTKSETSDAIKNTNVRAFLDTIAYAEGTSGVDGYRTIFGGSKFNSFADHPRIFIPFRDPRTGRRNRSSAAGRYQFINTTWDRMKASGPLLKDFSPQNQDIAAVRLIALSGALENVKAGNFDIAAIQVSNEWASFPASRSKQPKYSVPHLRKYYLSRGGKLTPVK